MSSTTIPKSVPSASNAYRLPFPGLQTTANIEALGVVETAPATFTPFPQLALELRRKIWGISAGFPQIIGLRSAKSGDSLEGTAARCHLLSVNKEARTEALRFKVDLCEAFESPQSPKVYVNLAVDTIWLTGSGLPWTLIDTLAPGIEHLAVDYAHFHGGDSAGAPSDDRSNHSFILKMGVEHVIMVPKSEVIGQHESTIFITPNTGPGPYSHRLPPNLSLGDTHEVTWGDMLIHEQQRFEEMLNITSRLVDYMIARSMHTLKLSTFGYSKFITNFQ